MPFIAKKSTAQSKISFCPFFNIAIFWALQMYYIYILVQVVSWHTTEFIKPCRVCSAPARRHGHAHLPDAREDTGNRTIYKASEVQALQQWWRWLGTFFPIVVRAQHIATRVVIAAIQVRYQLCNKSGRIRWRSGQRKEALQGCLVWVSQAWRRMSNVLLAGESIP